MKGHNAHKNVIASVVLQTSAKPFVFGSFTALPNADVVVVKKKH